MKILGFLMVIASIVLSGCSAADMRAFDDAMNNKYYPDQSDVKYVLDIRWETGVRNGSAYQKIKNTGGDYCKVRVTYEDDTQSIYRLEPHESLGKLYMSLYNQATFMEALCNKTRHVFAEQFK